MAVRSGVYNDNNGQGSVFLPAPAGKQRPAANSLKRICLPRAGKDTAVPLSGRAATITDHAGTAVRRHTGMQYA